MSYVLWIWMIIAIKVENRTVRLICHTWVFKFNKRKKKLSPVLEHYFPTIITKLTMPYIDKTKSKSYDPSGAVWNIITT